MTWEELKSHIEVMDEQQKKTDVTVYLKKTDEYIPIEDIDFAVDSNNVLEMNHPFVVADF